MVCIGILLRRPPRSSSSTTSQANKRSNRAPQATYMAQSGAEMNRQGMLCCSDTKYLVQIEDGEETATEDINKLFTTTRNGMVESPW